MGTVATDLKGHSGSIESLAWDPNNSDRVATASTDRTVRIWDVKCMFFHFRFLYRFRNCSYLNKTTINKIASRCIKTIDTKRENLDIVWNPTSSHIAVGNRHDKITFINTKTWAIESTITTDEEINEFSWMNDGYLFCVTLGSGEIKFYEWANESEDDKEKEKDASPKCVYTFQAHSSPILSLDFDPRGRLFATGSTDAIIHIWDIQNLLCIKSLPQVTSPIKSLSFSFDGELIAAGSEDNFIYVFRVDNGEVLKKIPVMVPTLSVSWHPNRHILAYAGEEIGRNEGIVRVFGYSTTGTTTNANATANATSSANANTASSAMGHSASSSAASRSYVPKPMLPHPPPAPQFFQQYAPQWNPGYYQGQQRSGYRYG